MDTFQYSEKLFFLAEVGTDVVVSSFPQQKPNSIFQLAFGLLQKISLWPTKICDSYVLFKMTFSQMNGGYEFWSLNKIARSKTLNVDYKPQLHDFNVTTIKLPISLSFWKSFPESLS